MKITTYKTDKKVQKVPKPSTEYSNSHIVTIMAIDMGSVREVTL